jgi:transposase
MVHLRTTDPTTTAACPQCGVFCGVFSTSVRQRRITRPKDLPYGEAPSVVRWHKRQFACRERSCPRTAFPESIAELPPYAPRHRPNPTSGEPRSAPAG